MTTKHTFLIPLFLTATAFSQSPSPSTSPASAEPAFEIAGPVDTKMFIPADLMSGPRYSVGDTAENDGLNNTYFLASADNTWGITTGLALRRRIRELYAIDKLRQMSQTEEFTRAMENSAKQKVQGVEGIIRNPFGTLENIPMGASRFFGRIGEGLKGGQTEDEGNVVQNLVGLEKAKMALAVKLGVSPYSYNQELQALLTKNARAVVLGGLVVSAATAAVGGTAGDVASALNVNQTLQATLINSTADDLRIRDRKKLFALGVSREHADELLRQPWYSPWTETILIDALSTIGVDPTKFITTACQALTEQDAIYFQRLAQVLARYHTTKAHLRSFHIEGGTLCALDQNGILVFPLSCDYAIWDKRAAAQVAEFSALRQGQDDIKGLALWVDGKTSARAAQELKNRKIDLATDVLAQK